MLNKPAHHPSWQWNSIRPRESVYQDIIWDLFQELMAWLPWLDKLQERKEVYGIDELNELYISYMRSYLKNRDDIIDNEILPNPEYFAEIEDFAAKNYMFDVLIDGYTSDSNRNHDIGGSQILPLLPYTNQLPLLHELEYGKKSMHIEKSRRAGASTWISFQHRRNLKHKKNMVMLASNKSTKDIDLKDDTKNNSTFSRIDFHFYHSIFIPDDWENDKIYNTPERKQNGTAIYRGHKPILVIYGTNRLDGSVFGKGTGTGTASHEYYGDEIDVYADANPNTEQELFSAVSASTNRMILFSTYRSIKYSFYKVKKTFNTSAWSFIRLHWEDNPTCNKAWYNRETGKINDDVKKAREFDINPQAAITGRVFPNFTAKYEITKAEAVEKWGAMTPKNGWVTMIASDNGGTRMSQNYNLIRVHKNSSTIFIEDTFFIDNTSMPEDVKDWAMSHGFDMYDETIYGDRAIKDDHTFVDHSTAFLLREQGFNVIEVGNRDMSIVHRNIRKRIDNGEFWVNKDCEILVTMLQLYRYKEDGSINKEDSHCGDAISYGIKGFFLNGGLIGTHKY